MTTTTTADRFTVELTVEQIDQIEAALLLYQDELKDTYYGRLETELLIYQEELKTSKNNPAISNQLIIDRNLAERAGKPKPAPVQPIDVQLCLMEDTFKAFQAVKKERQRRFDALLNDTTRMPEGDESQF